MTNSEHPALTMTIQNTSFEKWFEEVNRLAEVNYPDLVRPYHIPYWRAEYRSGLTPASAHCSNSTDPLTLRQSKTTGGKTMFIIYAIFSTFPMIYKSFYGTEAQFGYLKNPSECCFMIPPTTWECE